MVQGENSRIPADAIRNELNRILSSHEFRSSKRSQEFLRYVVENTLSGHHESLKERVIGIDVFGRAPSYDPSEDATVRVKAGEVRKRLGLYYATDGIQDPLRIELPAGTYVPEFRRPETNGHPEDVQLAAVHPDSENDRTHVWGSRWQIAIAIAIAALAGSVALFWTQNHAQPTMLDQFWAPVLQGTAPVALCAAYVPVMGRDPNANPPLRAEDDVLLNDQFVGGGDLIAMSRLSSMLTRLQRPYRVRIGNEISLHDLETAPAILSRDRHTPEDYAIISRVFHPDTHAMLVELAGITQYGTDAASDLVTNPELFTEAFHGAPSGWTGKNLQIVIHVKVIAGAPSSPKVVGSYFW
jgi:hypothetical protein